jgi:hypothetical protein
MLFTRVSCLNQRIVARSLTRQRDTGRLIPTIRLRPRPKAHLRRRTAHLPAGFVDDLLDWKEQQPAAGQATNRFAIACSKPVRVSLVLLFWPFGELTRVDLDENAVNCSTALLKSLNLPDDRFR